MVVTAPYAKRLSRKGFFCIYGPFNYAGKYTSESNQLFDHNLKNRSVNMGIRDFEDIEILASGLGLFLIDDLTMPANNRLLVLGKRED